MQTHQCDDTVYIKNGKPLGNFGDNDNRTWGGWGSNKCTGCWAYYAADLEFYVPSIVTSASTDDSIWVGQGGANANALSQAGVEEDSTFYLAKYSMFYENIGSGYCASDSDPHSPFLVNPGDSIYVYTNRYGHDIMNDYTTGNYFTKDWGCGTTDSAEFILERNGCANPPPCVSFAQFSTFAARHAEYEDSTSTWYTVPNNSGGYGDGFYRWQINISSNQLLVSDGSVSNDSGYGSTWTWTWTWYRGS